MFAFVFGTEREFFCGEDCGARGYADQNAVGVRYLLAGRDRVVVFNFYNLVVDIGIERLGNKTRAYALDLMRTRRLRL